MVDSSPAASVDGDAEDVASEDGDAALVVAVMDESRDGSVAASSRSASPEHQRVLASDLPADVESPAPAAEAEEAPAASALELGLAPAPEDLDPLELLITRWIRIETKPWGRRLDNPKLASALTLGRTELSHAELKSWGMDPSSLLEDVCFIAADGSHFELAADVGSFVCPRCRLVLLSVTADGLVVSTASATQSRLRNRCPCTSGAPIRLDVHAKHNRNRSPLDLLREHIGAFELEARGSRTKSSGEGVGAEAPASAPAAATSTRDAPKSKKLVSSKSPRGTFSSYGPWFKALPPATGTPRSLIRDVTTEALYRRFQVEHANRVLGDDEREMQSERRDFERERAGQHKEHGAAIVDAERQQRRRASEARQSIAEGHRLGGSVLHESLAIGFQEIKNDRRDVLERQKLRVVDTKLMQRRAKQNVASVKDANRVQGKEGRMQVFVAKKIKDEALLAQNVEKWEQASRVREESNLFLTAEARAAWLDNNAQAGATLKTIRDEGRRQRENERLDHLSGAFNFREDVRMWQASGRAIRARIEEERRMQGQLARERRGRDEEEHAQACYQRFLSRREAHDAVCEARHADEFLVAEFEQWRRALGEAESGHATARAAAARRATVSRRQKRRHERGVMKGLLQLVSTRAPEGEEVRL